MPPEKVDYSKTVLLPETAFPMKASLAVHEPLRLKAWEESGIYARLREQRRGAPRWILHDGPPFANGDIHMGTALNKVLKDVWIRYKTLRGFDAPYVPGWDTHGMPIEYKISRELKGKPVTPLELRRLCRAEAEKWVDKQRMQFKRLGVWGDWERPYITMDPAFEAGQFDAYWALLKKGQVYRALKPVHWSWATQTALAEAELEYQEKTSTQVYVKYPLGAESARQVLGLSAEQARSAFAVIWTTTPWTLPASLAITANEKFDYALYAVDGENWLMAKALANNVFGALPALADLKGTDRTGALAKLAEHKIWEGKGAELETLAARHPFIDRDIRFCLAPYVTSDAGTGLVHTAPGHGAEDYVTGVRYGLEIFCPVDERGCYTDAVQPPELKGLRVTDPATDQAVLDLLVARGRLVHSEKFKHSYPHDWRSKQPVIFRATRQWFMSLTTNGLRDTVMDATAKVDWINPWGRERFANMMKDRADWCISRQRFWGVPIYMFYCRVCGDERFDEACYLKLKPVVAREGGDAWFDPSRPISDFLPEGTLCKACGSGDFRKETDTLDVWFDSGSSSISVLRAREDQAFPADLYLEGSDQYRGWFQSSMLVSCAVNGGAPYKAVLSTGWTLDAQGRAMHKSAGNAVDPLKVMDLYGADVLRLWVASEDCTADMTVSDDLFKAVADNYRRLRISFRWLLSILNDFDPSHDAVPTADLPAFDRWLLARLDGLVEGVTADMEAYQLHKAFSRLQAFCAGELSSLAFDVHKDTLYTLAENDPRRRAAQTAFHQVLLTLLRLAAPVLCFTAEEAWDHLPAGQRQGSGVHFSDWPRTDPSRRDQGLEEDFKVLLELVRPVVTKRLEEARAAKLIGHPYDAEVVLSVHSKKLLRLLNQYLDFLPQLFVVSRVSLGSAAPRDGLALGADEVQVAPREAHKCVRCWRRPGDVPEEGGICGRCVEALEHA
jgi:isoleucyl-tRNA synthetase